MTDPEQARADRDAKEEARRLRRARQNIRNLVASLAASLGIVAFLVLVVARPDQTIPQPIDYRSVAENSAGSTPVELIVPNLDETWSSNRAEITEEGFGSVWSIGLINTTGDYVEFAQVFDASTDAVADLVGPGGVESSTNLAGSTDITWTVIDRSGVTDPGNASWAVVTETTQGQLVISGTSQSGVFFVASIVQADNPSLWPEGS